MSGALPPRQTMHHARRVTPIPSFALEQLLDYWVIRRSLTAIREGQLGGDELATCGSIMRIAAVSCVLRSKTELRTRS